MSRMIRKMGNILIASIMLMGLWGCWKVGNSNQAVAQPNRMNQTQMNNRQNPAIDRRLVDANTRFGFKLFSEILKQQPNQNIFVSPTSVAIALAMTYTGASGETQQAMAKTLELQGMPLTEVQQAYANLRLTLENPDPNVKLSVANSLWARKDIDFKPEFLQTNQKFFGAQVTDLDFTDSQASQQINQWVSQKTNGKINQIVDRLQPDDLLFLVNAIYFKGNWSAEFNPRLTQQRPFYLSRGQKTHPMMSQTGDYRYLETNEFQAISLPYSQGRFSLYVFLPKPNSTLNTFYQQLNPQTWEQWMRQFRKRDGTIVLPRFKLEYGIELSNALKALGMGVAFDAQTADFSAMSAVAAKIDQVKHKTFVEVNEEGTEAAAVTSVGIRATSIQMPTEPFQMTVDRPFFCVIRDNQSGTVLFMGSIVNPQS